MTGDDWRQMVRDLPAAILLVAGLIAMCALLITVTP